MTSHKKFNQFLVSVKKYATTIFVIAFVHLLSKYFVEFESLTLINPYIFFGIFYAFFAGLKQCLVFFICLSIVHVSTKLGKVNLEKIDNVFQYSEIPFLLILGVLTLGIALFSDQQRDEIKKQKKSNKDHQKQKDGLIKIIDDLKTKNLQVEQKIVTNDRTISRFLKHSTKLTNSHSNSINQYILDCLLDLTGIEDAGIFMKSGGESVYQLLSASENFPLEVGEGIEMSSTNSFIANSAIKNKSISHVADADSKPLSHDPFVLAIPLLHPVNLEVNFLITASHIDFPMLNIELINQLEEMTQWLRTLLYNSYENAVNEQSVGVDQVTGFLSNSKLQQDIPEMVSKCRRSNFSLSILKIALEPNVALDDSSKKLLMRSISHDLEFEDYSSPLIYSDSQTLTYHILIISPDRKIEKIKQGLYQSLQKIEKLPIIESVIIRDWNKNEFIDDLDQWKLESNEA